MVEFIWSKSMSVGVAELDADHQKLIALLSEVNQSAEKSDGQGARETLLALFHYVKEHFSREERHMADIGFPGLVDHQALHDLLERDVVEALEDTSFSNAPDLALSIHGFLIHWLTQHILHDDQAYARFSRPSL